MPSGYTIPLPFEPSVPLTNPVGVYCLVVDLPYDLSYAVDLDFIPDYDAQA